jgi:N4-(beta-N-acetylglucosaminyl)-L-asparaginase
MELLRQGADPCEAVVAGVKIMEDDPEDDTVGLGGEPNEDGVVELDASVMHGPTHKSGAVASLRNIKNPAAVALMVLRRTDHCLIVGEGALRFARAHGFQEENLLTDKARRAWLKWKENHSKDDDWLGDDEIDRWKSDPKDAKRISEGPDNGRWPREELRFHYGTVHCAATDKDGDLGSVTSTSGLSWKIPGRVGDSPIIGAGNYCDNAVGAAGATGRGEATTVNCAAFAIVAEMERGLTPTQACLAVAKRIIDRTREKRNLDARGRPNFNVNLYALRKDGAHGGAALYKGGRYSADDGSGPRAFDSAWLLER